MEAKDYVLNSLEPPYEFRQWCIDLFDVIVFLKGNDYIGTAEIGRRRMTEKRLKKNTNFHNLYSKKYVSIVLSSPTKIEQHNYMIEREIDSITLKEKIYFTLFNLDVLENGEIKIISWYENYGVSPQHSFGHRSMSNMGSYPDYYHYKNNWINNSPLDGLVGNDLDHYDIHRAYKHRNDLIFCKKRNLNRMSEDIIKNNVDWRVMTKSRIKKYWVNIADNDMNFKEFKTFITLLKNGVKLKHMNYESLKFINIDIDKSKHPGISVTRIMNYVYKQKMNLSYYYDYLNTLKDIGVQAEADIVYFPKSLMQAHDNVVAALNIIKIKEDEKNLESITQKLSKLEYDGDIYSVVAPKSLTDIVLEGKNLSHCVGGSSYLNGHKKGEYAIMFIRLKEDKTKSYYTFTYQYSKKVSALHGYGNKEINDPNYPKVKDFVHNEWLNWVKAGCKKPKQKKERMQPSQQMVMQG